MVPGRQHLLLHRIEPRLAVLAFLRLEPLDGRAEPWVARSSERGAVLLVRQLDRVAEPGVRHLDDRLGAPAVRSGEHRQQPFDGVEPEDRLSPRKRLAPLTRRAAARAKL